MKFRNLPVGDFLWVARHNVSKEEIVLDCIVERKRMADLWQSITDGRYFEQRLRLKKSGISRVVYLIEENMPAQFYESSQLSSLQAMRTTLADLEATHGFMVHYEPDLFHSVAFLAHLSSLVINRYNKTAHILPLPFPSLGSDDATEDSAATEVSIRLFTKRYRGEPYAQFEKRTRKTGELSPSQFFASQLRVIKGCSAKTAQAIAKVYSSAKELISAFAAQPSASAQVLHLGFYHLRSFSCRKPCFKE